MTPTTDVLLRYHANGWKTVPVHRPDPSTGGCSCNKPTCPKPGKHPVGRFWPGGSSGPRDFVGRNVGVQPGPESQNLADVDKDCREAVIASPFLLPTTECAFGRGGKETHALYTVVDGAASFAKLHDPVLTGDQATIIELRWPEWDESEHRLKNIQTVFPPSLHVSGETIEWLREGHPTAVNGADLLAAVRHTAAAVLIARYARPKERHALVLLTANLLVRAGWKDDARIVRFMTAVFSAKNDPDKVAKIADGEGLLGKAEVTKADRQLAKAVNFGLLYGQGANGLRRYALGSFGVSLTAAEATRHRETFFRTYPGLRAWHRSVKDGPVDTRTLAGRRRVGVKRYTEKLNTPIQGTGADGLKRALGLLWERRAECPGAFPVLIVHDEVVVECLEGDADRARAWLIQCMTDGMAELIAPVPVEVEAAVARSWGG